MQSRLAVALVGSCLAACSASPGAIDYDGAALYAGNCANCHGTYGEGDGAVTPDLSVAMQDLRYLSARNDGAYPDEFVRRIVDGREVRIAHGPEGMPTWGNVFAQQEGYDESADKRVVGKIDAIVEFLASIQIAEEE